MIYFISTKLNPQRIENIKSSKKKEYEYIDFSKFFQVRTLPTNVKKTILWKYANCGKSDDISQNVHLDELFQNLKKKFHGISLRGLSSTLRAPLMYTIINYLPRRRHL